MGIKPVTVELSIKYEQIQSVWPLTHNTNKHKHDSRTSTELIPSGWCFQHDS